MSSDEPLYVNPDDRDALAMALPAFMIMAGEMAVRGGDKLIFGLFDLTVGQYSVLASLAGVPNVSMTDLKQSLILQRSASNLTQMVDDLEARSLVRRLPHPQDRRVSLVEITGNGRGLLEQVKPKYLSVMQALTDQYTMDELRTSFRVLREFILQTGGKLHMEVPRFARTSG